MLAEVAQMRKGISDVNSRLGSMGHTADKVGNLLKSAIIGAGAVWAGSKIKDFLSESIAAGRESNKVMAQTNAVLKSTSKAAGLTAKQISDMSTRLSNFTGVDDETIQSGENLLLTFTNIRDEVGGKFTGTFDTATQTMVDMSAALGQDMKSSAIQLGKALNDPVKGITALQRVGVSFTAQQKEQIATLVKHNQTTKAQAIILGELNREFGGSAAAAATPAQKLNVMIDNLKENIGQFLIPILDKFETFLVNNLPTAIAYLKPKFEEFIAGVKQNVEDMLPTLEKIGLFLVSAFESALPHLEDFGRFLEHNKAVVATFIGVLAGFSILNSIRKAIIAINVALAANPWTIAIVGVAALAAGLVYAYKHSETFRAIVNDAFKVVSAGAKFMWGIIKPIFDAFSKAIQAVGSWARWLWNNVFAPVFRFIGDGIAKLLHAIADMLHAISHVPGFGWVGDLADKLDSAANGAQSLANQIRNIPSSKRVDVNVYTHHISVHGQSSIDLVSRSGSGSGRLVSPSSRGSVTNNITVNTNGIVQTDAELGERIVEALAEAEKAGMVAFA